MPKRYIIPLGQLRKLHNVARRAQGQDQCEVCGLLVSDRDGRLELLFLSNRGPRPGHFRIDKEEYLATRKAVHRTEKRVVGIFHSHPISEAVPSRRDIRGAVVGLSLIYDVCGREARLWRILKRGRRRIAKEVPFCLERRGKRNTKRSNPQNEAEAQC